MKKFRIAAIVLLVIGLLGAGYGYYWHYVAGRLQIGVADWVTQQRGLGNEIAFDSDPISGFPFAFRTNFRSVRLLWRQPAATMSVQAETVLAEMRPWNLRDIFVASEQPVTLSLPSAQTEHVTVESGSARITLYADGRLQSVAPSLRRLEIEGSAGKYAAETMSARVDLPAVAPADYHQPLIEFDVAVGTLRLPAGQRAVTSEPIGTIAATGAVMGPVPPASNLREALSGWARAGGTVELKAFNFVQSPLSLAGEGTITLDDVSRPLGALTIRAQGLPETIDLLAKDGAIDAQSARTGSMMARGLAKPDGQGHQVVSVSLSLQQGYLWLGPVKLALLPALTW